MNLENDIKNLFLQWLNESDILKEISQRQKTIEGLIKSGNNKETIKEEDRLAELKRYQERNCILDGQIKELNDKISEYAIFEEPLEVWKCINSLNDDNKKYVECLCGGSDRLAILSLGRDDGKIDQLWSYLRNIAVKEDVEKVEVSKLNKYFEFCLKVANSTKSENKNYVKLDIKPESEFDIETCIKTADSKQIGKIGDIIVQGFKMGKDIKYQAIVRIE